MPSSSSEAAGGCGGAARGAWPAPDAIAEPDPCAGGRRRRSAASAPMTRANTSSTIFSTVVAAGSGGRTSDAGRAGGGFGDGAVSRERSSFLSSATCSARERMSASCGRLRRCGERRHRALRECGRRVLGAALHRPAEGAGDGARGGLADGLAKSRKGSGHAAGDLHRDARARSRRRRGHGGRRARLPQAKGWPIRRRGVPLRLVEGRQAPQSGPLRERVVDPSERGRQRRRGLRRGPSLAAVRPAGAGCAVAFAAVASRIPAVAGVPVVAVPLAGAALAGVAGLAPAGTPIPRVLPPTHPCGGGRGRHSAFKARRRRAASAPGTGHDGCGKAVRRTWGADTRHDTTRPWGVGVPPKQRKTWGQQRNYLDRNGENEKHSVGRQKQA